jgi:hypothetical protein
MSLPLLTVVSGSQSEERSICLLNVSEREAHAALCHIRHSFDSE